MVIKVPFFAIELSAIYVGIENTRFRGECVSVAAWLEVGRQIGAIHSAREQNANVVILFVQLVKLVLNFAVDVGRSVNRNTLRFRNWQNVFVLETFTKIYTVFPYIAEGNVGTEAKIFVCHNINNNINILMYNYIYNGIVATESTHRSKSTVPFLICFICGLFFV